MKQTGLVHAGFEQGTKARTTNSAELRGFEALDISPLAGYDNTE